MSFAVVNFENCVVVFVLPFFPMEWIVNSSSVHLNIRSAVLLFVIYEYSNTIKSNIRMPIGRKVFE